MAENQDERSTEDLSDEASPFRAEEYRRRGMVGQSREVSGVVALLAAATAAYVLSPKIGSSTMDFMREVFRSELSARADLGGNNVLSATMMKALKLFASLSLPVCMAGFVMGALGSFGQIGSVFSFEPLMPSLSKIDPLQGLRRMFSLRQGIEGLRLMLKIGILLAITYGLIRSESFHAPIYMSQDSGAMLGALGRIAKMVFLTLAGVIAVFAGIDFFFQRSEFNKQLRVTKEEAKREYKEREGDPQIKARVRAVQREMARRRMMQAVKKADVVITNPTHIAVALAYQKDKMAAPRVVAKGADFLAQKIKAVAAEAGVPLVENVPLARTLFKTVKVGHAIPRALYQAVAEVLAYVYRLRRKDFV